jgi:hypothetical protein
MLHALSVMHKRTYVYDKREVNVKLGSLAAGMLPGIVQHSSLVSRAFVPLCIIEDESFRVVLLGRNVMVASRISRTRRGRGCWRVTAGMTFNWRGL